MATTFRSHFRTAAPNDGTRAQSERKTASRTPAKSSSETEGRPSKAAQHVSKLAKRASRSITPSDKAEVGNTSQSSAAMRAGVRDSSAASTRLPVAQASETPSSTSRFVPPKQPLQSSSQRPPAMRTPSLVSGSSISTFDSPRTNALRRKPSTIERYAASKKAESVASDGKGNRTYTDYDDVTEAFEDSVLGISLPQQTAYVHNAAYVAANQKYRMPPDPTITEQAVPRYITPPVPIYAPSATPSTRYTDSPFSHAPTPSSASSYSPAVFATATNPQRAIQPSPVLNGRSHEKTDSSRLGLPPVRESSTSSSNSTVKPTFRAASAARDVPRKPVAAPPTRKSSETQRPASRGKLVKEKPRQKPPASSTKSPVQIPPELAHLNVEPSKPNLNKALPPIRPSRDGTPVLTGMSSPSPVVQSDLPKVYNTYHKRTPSQESNNPTSPLKSRFGLSPRAPSRQESPRIDSAISPPPAARSFARAPTLDNVPTQGPKLIRKDSPAVGPAPSPSKSPRFGFFTRKPKAETPKPPEKPKRQNVKGPAAGTGHEGYGRFGFRGRSGSTTSSAGARSASTDSNTSNVPQRNSQGRKSSVTTKDGSELDDFLRARLNPVVLRGSGSTVSNTASGYETQTASAPESKTSSMESYPKPRLLPSAIQSQSENARSPSKRPVPRPRAPSESSDDDPNSRYPTLAARRSLTRISQGDPAAHVRMPAPINTSRPSKDSSLDSYDAEGSALPRSDSTLPTDDIFDGREGMWLRTQKEEPPVKPSRRWNFFQRAQASPRSKGKEKAIPRDEENLTASLHHSRPSVEHYATLDPVEPVDLEEIENIMQENGTTPEDSMSESGMPSRMVPYERRHLSLLPAPLRGGYSAETTARPATNVPTIMFAPENSPSPELLRARHALPQQHPHVVNVKRSPIIPEVNEDNIRLAEPRNATAQSSRNVQTPELLSNALNTPETQFDDSPHRQPRLSPVGRIPKVVSKRDRDRKLSDSSFSRPFGRTQPRPTVQPPGSLYNQIRELASPIESGSQPVSSTSTRSDGHSGENKSSVDTNAPSSSTYRTSMDIHSNEFFAFPPRKDSDLSYSTTSAHQSWMAHLPPQEDDVWNEYNDLMDEVMSGRTPLLTSSSFGEPFQYSSMLYEPPPGPTHNMTGWNQPPWTQMPAPPQAQLPAPPVSGLGLAPLSVPQQIARFMQPSMSPLTTPNQLADFVDQYGNRSTSTLVSPNRGSNSGPRRPSLAHSSRSSIPTPGRNSMTQASRTSLPSARGSVTSSRHSRASGHSRSASLPDAHARNSQSSLTPSVRFNRDTQLLDIAEVEGDDQAAAANLRFGALMTSKWLSFGRVLFSPADNEMRLADDPKILIIDGLGSDWSFYVALAYPTATVYNLGPPPPNGSAWPGVNQKPPPNHRHINHASISTGFPFPKGFFTAVVFRFPLVATDDAYHSCIFECKRVLRPGGYLEVAVLDLDLMNMGSKARKAVRGLKTRMQGQDPNISLRNLSDVLVRLIGRRGFEDVQRCIVGVPAAGRIPRSQDISSRSSGASGKPSWQREDKRNHEFTFADLLEDARSSQIAPGKNNDETITKMVAKVGRWWYSTCYEKALFPGEQSIWNDHTLLRECERQGTSMRLLICHAQKPAAPRRRTVSV